MCMCVYIFNLCYITLLNSVYVFHTKLKIIRDSNVNDLLLFKQDRNSPDIARQCRTNDASNDEPKTEITDGLVEVRRLETSISHDFFGNSVFAMMRG